MSVVAHFFMSVRGSKFHERLAHFFVDIYSEADGQEPIEWIVLDKQDGKLLLLSKYNLFTKGYVSNAQVMWKNSEIRKYLNEKFISSSFSSIEQNQIYSKVFEEGDILFNDMVFLLSEEDVEHYLPTEESRKAPPSETYINKSGSAEYSCSWATRTVIKMDTYPYYRPIYVNNDGEIQEMRTRNIVLGVRPALWLDTTE